MMRFLAMTPLQQLDARLREQVLDVTHLRAALDVQMHRISQMYDHAELPRARERGRATVLAFSNGVIAR